MRSFLAFLPLLFVGTQQPPTGCRVPPAPCSWVVSRTVQPYTGTEVLSTIEADLCVLTSWALGYENRTPGQNGACAFDGMDILVEAAFSPDFHDVFVGGVTHASGVQFINGPFDGLVDFAGISGVTHTVGADALHVSTLGVTDPTFFEKPWTVWIRAVPLPSFSIQGTGPYTAVADPFAAAGLSVTYNP